MYINIIIYCNKSLEHFNKWLSPSYLASLYKTQLKTRKNLIKLMHSYSFWPKCVKEYTVCDQTPWFEPLPDRWRLEAKQEKHNKQHIFPVSLPLSGKSVHGCNVLCISVSITVSSTSPPYHRLDDKMNESKRRTVGEEILVDVGEGNLSCLTWSLVCRKAIWAARCQYPFTIIGR